MSFTFNGVKKDYIKASVSSNRPPWANIKRNILIVDGAPGGYLQNTTTDVRTIKVTVRLLNKNFTSMQELKEDLATWLITDQPCQLIFDDEPDRTYYAVVDGSLDSLTEIVNFGQGTINFLCPDPYKYGNYNSEVLGNTGSVTVLGSAETKPIYTINITQDTTYVAIGDGDQKLNLLGMPNMQTETPAEAETQIYRTDCSNTTGWSTPANAADYPVMGVLTSQNGEFIATSYGSDTQHWHGPALKYSLPSTIADFQFDVSIGLSKTGAGQAGAVVADLLDAQNNVVARLSITKHFGNLDQYYCKVQALNDANQIEVMNGGNAIITNSTGITAIMRLYRVGTLWTAKLFVLESIKWHGRTFSFFMPILTTKWNDTNNQASAAIAQVQVWELQRAALPVVSQNITDLAIYRVNSLASGQVPYVARAGDVVQFDHANEIIRVNGVDTTKDKAFIGEYFKLSPGSNNIVAEPDTAVSQVQVEWFDRWL